MIQSRAAQPITLRIGMALSICSRIARRSSSGILPDYNRPYRLSSISISSFLRCDSSATRRKS